MGYSKEQREANAKKKAEEALIDNLNNISDDKHNNSSVIANIASDEKQNSKVKIKNLPLNTNVIVRSNRYGQLIFICKKYNKRFDWDNVGTTQTLTLDELQAMRNESRKFFEKTWIVVDGFSDEEYADLYSPEEIYDYLTVTQYYKNLLCPENIDLLFTMSAEEIEKRIKSSSSGSRDLIIVRANELIEARKLDALTVIETLEDVLKCELSRPERKK
jgi:hypothetical protein